MFLLGHHTIANCVLFSLITYYLATFQGGGGAVGGGGGAGGTGGLGGGGGVVWGGGEGYNKFTLPGLFFSINDNALI